MRRQVAPDEDGESQPRQEHISADAPRPHRQPRPGAPPPPSRGGPRAGGRGCRGRQPPPPWPPCVLLITLLRGPPAVPAALRRAPDDPGDAFYDQPDKMEALQPPGGRV